MKELTYYQSLIHVTGTAATSGDNTLIAAPGVGRQIVISGLVIQNESSTSTTAILKFGSTAKMRTLLVSQGDGIVRDLEPAWEVGANTALVLNLSGANSHGYSISYWIDGAQ